MSANGTKLIAAAGYHSVYTSSDFGVTWTSNNLDGAVDPAGVASSADGVKLAVSASLGAVYTSMDAGVTWISNNIGTLVSDMACVTSSADGGKLSVGPGGNGGRIYTSTNSGVTWTTNNASQVWGGMASSADGIKLVAVGYPGIYTSVNSAGTWVSNSVPRLEWTSVASSADGGRLVAAANGSIWTAQTTVAPSVGISAANGTLVLSWIVASTNFVLQQDSGLSPANWTDVTNAPVLNLTSLQDVVTLPLTAGSCFYQLVTE
jgi:hypothetical protein